MKAFLAIIAALAVLALVACSDPNAASPDNKAYWHAAKWAEYMEGK